MPYITGISIPLNSIAQLFAHQTIPSKKQSPNVFLDQVKRNTEVMSESLIVISQIQLPPIDINIKAQTPYQAYCFFINIVSTVKDFLYIIDPYIDASLFNCFFYRLNNSLKIHLVSSPDKWNKSVKGQVEAVGNLFIVEYPYYIRKDIPDLHDRFIITETSAYQLAGSLKDATKKADFSVIQVSEARRVELIGNYFS